MARKRDPRRDEAFELFKKFNGTITNREISEKLSVPEKTISAWKSRDKWNEVLRKDECSTSNNECSTTNKGGAPIGNQNAIGNKGNSRASPPKRNKNALKTGEYETIFFDTLSDDEKDIYSSLDDDPSFVLSEEIRLLKIRQLRMMKRIKEAESGLNDEEVDRLQQMRKIKTPIEKDGKKLEIKREVMQDVQVSRKTYRKIDDILSIEDALTRISNQLTKAIKQLNALATEESRNKVYNNQANKLEVEIDMLKLKADLLRSDSEKSTEEKLDELLEKISGELDGTS
ncbi:small subunit of terminase [Enterococcus faecium]|uniref:phage terminase small subunit n=1 Tax=Enterococcus faecium TaxID=1352 RepID=UPI00100DA7FA|nr:phage terminase small subunit [Enterococcus faecium]EGP4716571.1 small subunit of terminase [Enterococcus faecium]RXW92149.1 small subunit of terminase [Enterococcus faecium]HAQ3750664.1 small subunit of terminase [Enterococcus faecium]